MNTNINRTDFPSFGNTYCATPYDISASFFYFGSFEEYKAKADALRNDYGDPVEEFEFQFIDGDGCELFHSLDVNQCTLEQWFEEFEMLDENQVDAAIFLAGRGFDADKIKEEIENVYLFEGTAREYAEQYAEDTGLLNGIPEEVKRYFNYDAYANDLTTSGDVTEERINGTDYIVQARV